MTVMVDLDRALRERLSAAGVEVSGLFGPGLGPWQAWLRLRDHDGRRATLVDLYELEAASRGLRPEDLSAGDRKRLKALSLRFRRPGLPEVVPGSERDGDPHEVTSYDPVWPVRFAGWRDRLAAALGPVAAGIEHVGSTAVPGLAAKPVIDILVSVPDVGDERSYLPPLESAGLVLRLRETGHRFLWPPRTEPRAVHVHVCGSGSSWERDHLLFRDYLRTHPGVCARYASVKRDLIHHWNGDRPAYGAAKTAFVLDALAQAVDWADRTGWAPRPHQILAMRPHLPAPDYRRMDPASARYLIRIKGHLGVTLLSAFPAMASKRQGPETVLTGLLDRPALHGVLAEIEALGLDLLEVRQLTPGARTTERGDDQRPGG
jgi:GrpB-like predicted nucleotidyltransferase (UPF0157 family)